MEIDKDFLGKLFEQAVENPRLRQSFDLRTSSEDNSQRILNALLPGTVFPFIDIQTAMRMYCFCVVNL